jgi:glutathione S-transferase
MSLKVWGRATSVNVQKVMWTVGELGLPHERIDAGGAFGRNDTPEYRAMNPNGLVPVLDDNGFTLWESNAIVRYLASTYGRGTLAPQDAQAFAKADQWMDWTATSLYYEIITTCFWGLIRTPAADRNVASVEAAAKRAGERLALLDTHLATRAYIGGDALTMADLPVGSLMYRYYTMDIARPSLPNVEAWYGRLATRAPYQTHVMMDYSAMKVPGA